MARVIAAETYIFDYVRARKINKPFEPVGTMPMLNFYSDRHLRCLPATRVSGAKPHSQIGAFGARIAMS